MNVVAVEEVVTVGNVVDAEEVLATVVEVVVVATGVAAVDLAAVILGGKTPGAPAA